MSKGTDGYTEVAEVETGPFSDTDDGYSGYDLSSTDTSTSSGSDDRLKHYNVRDPSPEMRQEQLFRAFIDMRSSVLRWTLSEKIPAIKDKELETLIDLAETDTTEQSSQRKMLPHYIDKYVSPSELGGRTNILRDTAGSKHPASAENFQKKLSIINMEAARNAILKEYTGGKEERVASLLQAENYFAIHHMLFHNIAPTIAGKTRNFDVKRSTVEFASFGIEERLQVVFDAMKDDKALNQEGVSKETFFTRLAVYDTLVYLVHPAINGNTRTKDVLMDSFCNIHGFEYPINFLQSKSYKIAHNNTSHDAMDIAAIFMPGTYDHTAEELSNVLNKPSMLEALEDKLSTNYAQLLINGRSEIAAMDKKTTIEGLRKPITTVPGKNTPLSSSSPSTTKQSRCLEDITSPRAKSGLRDSCDKWGLTISPQKTSSKSPSPEPRLSPSPVTVRKKLFTSTADLAKTHSDAVKKGRSNSANDKFMSL